MYRSKVISTGLIEAKKYDTDMKYYQAHLKLIDKMSERYKDNFILVMEDYLLYAKRAQSQTNSRMETCKLIGVVQYYCFEHKIDCVLQTAAQVKKRWSDEILEHEGIELPTTHAERHARDAIRHAMHYTYFGK